MMGMNEPDFVRTAAAGLAVTPRSREKDAACGGSLDDTNEGLFTASLWLPAIEQYAAATGLTVVLFQANGKMVQVKKPSTPLYDLFEEHGFHSGLFAECAKRCLDQVTVRPALVGTEASGLSVIGTSLVLDGVVVGAAVAGFALSRFSQAEGIQRWAQATGVPFDRLWETAKRMAPLSEGRLRLHGELLQVLGDALLRENHRTRQYEAATRRLEAADTAKDDFMAVLSHELRTPLVPILGWAHLLKKHEGSEQVRRAAEVIERNARSQSRMIEDLLDINLITRGSVRLNVHVHDLRAIVNTSLEGCAAEVERKGSRLEIVDESGPLRVSGDLGRLEQVFRNIMNNAVKFTPATGRIRVVMSREGNQALVIVADAGQGIAPEFLPFVFDRFRQQERGTRRAHEGLGIGLALVKQLTELHRGTVTVTSAGEGRGTEVVVRLPLAAEVPILERPPSTPWAAPLAGVSRLVAKE